MSSSKSLPYSLLGEKTSLTGNISSTSDFRIDGELNGNISTKGRVTLGPTALVKGNINCGELHIEGEVNGLLNIKNTVWIKPKAKVKGEIKYGNLLVEKGADLNAKCSHQT